MRCSPLDAVITAVGMVNDLPVMMTAVVIAMVVMLMASKPLTNFVNAHPTIVVLCLSFLLMIGLSLIAEGFGPAYSERLPVCGDRFSRS
ncbi:Integral membrane protein TerC family [Serratia rubidaea]|uniref:Integral membrane protein TerC family n=1 Tax=Serratia rubidaea TaxID=61652 RepID=A0A4U9HN50_SERRU|nr:Integral membrane protein TerC family [Serratia rubidaea]